MNVSFIEKCTSHSSNVYSFVNNRNDELQNSFTVAVWKFFVDRPETREPKPCATFSAQ